MSSFDLMDDSVVTRIIERGVDSLRQTCTPRRPFTTVGVEGSGHHIFSSMPAELCGAGLASNRTSSIASCGGLASFPYRSSWRHQNSPTLSTQMGLRGRPSPNVKYLVLLRDPVDAVTSALSRFWNCAASPPDTLQRELWASIEAMRAMNAFVSQIRPEDCTIVVSHELLVSSPQSHARSLAAFLGVDEADPALQTFLSHAVRSTNPRCDATRHLGVLNSKLTSCLNGSHSHGRQSRGREIAGISELCEQLAAQGACTGQSAGASSGGCVLAFREAWAEFVMRERERLPNVLPRPREGRWCGGRVTPRQ